jgi:hypothetical protein
MAVKVVTSRVGIREGIAGGQRAIKMVQPVCAECQAEYKHPLWWKLCPKEHDMFYTTTQGYMEKQPDGTFRRITVERVPIVEEKDGRRVISGYEEIELPIKRTLNLVQVPMGVRVNSGKALLDARYWGFKDLGDFNLRFMCEYRDCWEQPDTLLDTPYGRFCTATQARLVGADEEGIVMEVYDEKKRKAQLRAINLEHIDDSDV